MLYLFAALPLCLFSWLHRRERGATAGFGWVVPVAMGAASLIGKLFKNKKANKERQAAYDAEKAEYESKLPGMQTEAEDAARRRDVRANLRASLARAYGLDKVLGGFYDFPASRTKTNVSNPFASLKRPGGFSWGDFAGDAAETAGSTIGSGVQGGAKGFLGFSGLGGKKMGTPSQDTSRDFPTRYDE